MHLDAKSNPYADAVGMKMLDACPKAVWAAIAYSFAMRLSEDNHARAIETLKRDRKAAATGEPGRRKCLRCGLQFQSMGPANRVCDNCKQSEDWRRDPGRRYRGVPG